PFRALPPLLCSLSTHASAPLLFPLSLHDALPIWATAAFLAFVGLAPGQGPAGVEQAAVQPLLALDRLLVETARVQLARQLSRLLDRKSTRLNSSHQIISYAVFCLKKKKK